MLEAFFTVLGWTVIALCLIGMWMAYCILRTNRDTALKAEKTSDYFNLHVHKDRNRRLAWTYQESNNTSPEAHCWRLMTFRNPWKLYGPITISLIKGYDMQDDFWEWYRWCYNAGLLPHLQKTLLRRMMKWEYAINPMVYTFVCEWGFSLDEYRPAPPKPVMMEGADEYDDIMRIQEAVERL